MKLTKYRLKKIISSTNNQTKKKFNRNIKKLHHTNSIRNNKYFNLRNKTLKY
jgi:hypothetical protein